MVTSDGWVKVLDFGLAKFAEPGESAGRFAGPDRARSSPFHLSDASICVAGMRAAEGCLHNRLTRVYVAAAE